MVTSKMGAMKVLSLILLQLWSIKGFELYVHISIRFYHCEHKLRFADLIMSLKTSFFNGCNAMLCSQCCNIVTVMSACWLLMAWHLFGARTSATIMLVQACWYIWVSSRWCDCLVTKFCYQMIAKPGNKTDTPLWTDPYIRSIST